MTSLSEKSVITQLLNSTEPAVRLKTHLRLLDHEYDTSEVKKLVVNLKKKSPLISSLFSYLPKDETSETFHVYTKWQGTHWILAQLADIGYPPGDKDLTPSINRVMNWLLSDKHWKSKLSINGRRRFCASQEGNGLYAAVSLGFFDERCKLLADRLIQHQWSDGGWNCDKKPEVRKSSYHESLLPLRALNRYLKEEKSPQLINAIEKVAELFHKRKLFKRISHGEVINKRRLSLHYPAYLHYDILSALKVLAEANKLQDKRCHDALDLLESKRLSDGGYPKEKKYCQSSNPETSYFSPADWKSVNRRKMNEWVTIDALFILKKAKRIDLDY